jgi:S1-C subfamily serine protease
VTGEVQNSEVLRRVDHVMPPGAVGALGSFNDLVGTSVFPRYLEPFAHEQIAEVGPPPPRIAEDPQVRAAQASVLKVRGENACGQGVEGSGFLYQPDRLMTNAHVVAGVATPHVVLADREVEATVVLYDPQLDVAVLAVPGLGLPSLAFDRSAGPPDAGAVLGYPQDGPYHVEGARIRADQRLRSPDIYSHGTVLREVFSLRSTIRPGNSGGPLVSRDGQVTGVVFAASVTDTSTGYALTAEQVAQAAAQGISTSEPVSTGDCA